MLFPNTLCFFFFITYNFGAEAERSYILLRFEAENVLYMFLKLHGIHYMYFSKSMRTFERTYQSALPAEIWYQELLIMTNRDVCHHQYIDFIFGLAK